jgi:signal transduction histidine kinase
MLFKKFGKIERYGKGLDVNIDGWGLGLYLSKEIVSLHGGEITVKSEGRNKGAEFVIRLFKTE